jgi:excisionase family DNA binding protein
MTGGTAGRPRRSGGARKSRRTGRAPNLYTAQDVADFCEVDLKTVHHWVTRGKVPHFRTDGGHLRFRRNDVVRFLRAHAYPLADTLVRARPTVAFALGPSAFVDAPVSLEEMAKRLGSRFAVRRHANAAVAIAHVLADEPDALILAADDATIALPATIAALKAEPSLAWMVVAAVSEAAAVPSLRTAGADIALAGRDVAKLTGELARALAVS